jgi:hypothetical protein
LTLTCIFKVGADTSTDTCGKKFEEEGAESAQDKKGT